MSGIIGNLRGVNIITRVNPATESFVMDMGNVLLTEILVLVTPNIILNRITAPPIEIFQQSRQPHHRLDIPRTYQLCHQHQNPLPDRL